MMWALVVLGIGELAIVHFLVSLWNLTVALVLSAISLAGIIWFVALIRSFRRLPVRIEGDRLILRAGTLFRVETPLANVSGVRGQWDSNALKAPGILNMAMMSYPNVLVDFGTPVPRGKREVRGVAHRLDDAAAFTRALASARPAGK